MSYAHELPSENASPSSEVDSLLSASFEHLEIAIQQQKDDPEKRFILMDHLRLRRLGRGPMRNFALISLGSAFDIDTEYVPEPQSERVDIYLPRLGENDDLALIFRSLSLLHETTPPRSFSDNTLYAVFRHRLPNGVSRAELLTRTHSPIRKVLNPPLTQGRYGHRARKAFLDTIADRLVRFVPVQMLD